MYYELIKMLIDYERRNHPETYDATKTVGGNFIIFDQKPPG